MAVDWAGRNRVCERRRRETGDGRRETGDGRREMGAAAPQEMGYRRSEMGAKLEGPVAEEVGGGDGEGEDETGILAKVAALGAGN